MSEESGKRPVSPRRPQIVMDAAGPRPTPDSLRGKPRTAVAKRAPDAAAPKPAAPKPAAPPRGRKPGGG